MVHSETLRNSLLDEIRDLYHAEKQLTKALPKLARASTNAELRSAFEAHLDQTEEHVARLEQIFDLLDERAKAKPCPGMSGILVEGADLISELNRGPVLDVVLIAASQRVEHYEIAAYGTAVAWAHTLGLEDVATLLGQTLEEEKAADDKLSSLAESGLNAEAASQADETDEELATAHAGGRRANGAHSKTQSRKRR